MKCRGTKTNTKFQSDSKMVKTLSLHIIAANGIARTLSSCRDAFKVQSLICANSYDKEG